MFYEAILATAALLRFGFGNYIIRNKFFRIAVLCAGWILFAFSQAAVQRMINVYPASAIRNYFICLSIEAVVLIVLFRRFSK